MNETLESISLYISLVLSDRKDQSIYVNVCIIFDFEDGGLLLNFRGIHNIRYFVSLSHFIC